MLRRESNSGSIDDFAHVASQYCLSDALSKHSAKADELMRAVEAGIIEQVDLHPPLRSLLRQAFYVIGYVTHFPHPLGLMP